MRYVVAILGTAIAICFRFLLPQAIADQFPFAPFFLAVLFAARFGGYGPAYVSVVLGAVITAVIVIPWETASWADFIGLEIFVLVGIGIAQLGGMMQQSVEQLKRTVQEAKEAEQRRATRLRINEILASSSDPTVAIGDLLQTICHRLNWQVGAFWMVDAIENVMRCNQIYDEVPGDISEFTSITQNITLPQGIGLPGHIWARGKPTWVENVGNDPTLPRAGIALNVGLKGAFGFPLLSKGQVIGVIEFLSHEVKELDDDLLEMFGALGGQIGHFIERRRAEEALQQSEERFSRFMLQLPGLAWMKDLEGRYVFVNSAAEVAFGKSRLELYGKTDSEVFPEVIAEQFQKNDQAALLSEGGVQVIETLEQSDGTHYSLVSKFPIVGGNNRVAFVGGMAIDISDRLKAEDALKESNRLKDEFLAMLAHELRNPLAPIRNALEVMRLPNVTPETIDEVRQMAERQVQHMAVLLDDLLDIARFTRGHIELQVEQVDLSELIARTVNAARHLFEKRNHVLSVSVAGQLVVEGDPHRLEQIFINLLNNAAKYTDPGGQILVEAIAMDDDIVIRIQDTGIGIAPEMLPLIFEPFVQAERRIDRAQGGIGVGLTLVKQLVELHQGSITATSEGRGLGSTFIVRLPLATPSIKPSEVPVESKNGECDRLISRRILIVDDNVDAATTLRLLLKTMGQEVETANDGPTALEVVKEFQPDFVLLDIGMPGMDGYEVARRLRGLPRTEQTIIVALTGWGQDEDRRQSHEAGFDHHLVKPIELSELAKLLAR